MNENEIDPFLEPESQDQQALSKEDEALKLAYTNVFGSQDAGPVLGDLARECDLFTFLKMPSNEALQESNGKRQIILYIFEMIGYDEETLINKLKE